MKRTSIVTLLLLLVIALVSCNQNLYSRMGGKSSRISCGCPGQRVR